MPWRDQQSIDAVKQYVRIAMATLFFVAMLYLLIAQRIDIDKMLAILAGLSGVNQVGQFIVHRKEARAKEVAITQQPGWE